MGFFEKLMGFFESSDSQVSHEYYTSDGRYCKKYKNGVVEITNSSGITHRYNEEPRYAEDGAKIKAEMDRIVNTFDRKH